MSTASHDDAKNVDTDTVVPTLDYDTQQVQRPPIDYSSVSAFALSSRRRFASLWTPRFTLSLLAGQVVSLCITCTNVTTTELVNRNWALPTTQSVFLCALWIFL